MTPPPSLDETPLLTSGSKRHNVENVLDLLHLLEYLSDECAVAPPWKFSLFIFPCYLDDALFFLGCKHGQVYNTRFRDARGLWRPFIPEFLERHYHRVPALVLGDGFWAYDYCTTGYFKDLNVVVTRAEYPEEFARVEAAIQEYLEKLAPVYEARAVARARADPRRPWEACSICTSIPADSYGLWAGEDLRDGEIPVNARYLHVLGAPVFNAHETYRHQCVKRCPECLTCYEWKFDYEFLIPASEDEVWLTRLPPVAAREWKEKIFETVRKAKTPLKADPQHYVAFLEEVSSRTPRTRLRAIRAAAFFFYREQLVLDRDLRPFVPALVHALAHHPHVPRKENCPGFWIETTLREYGLRYPARREEVARAMADVEPTTKGEEFDRLWWEVAPGDLN